MPPSTRGVTGSISPGSCSPPCSAAGPRPTPSSEATRRVRGVRRKPTRSSSAPGAAGGIASGRGPRRLPPMHPPRIRSRRRGRRSNRSSLLRALSQERAEEGRLDARLAEERADQPSVPVEVGGAANLLLEIVGGDRGQQRLDLLVRE